MKRVFVEKGVVVLMFVLVLTVFSIAERDTKKLVKMYSGGRAAAVASKANDLPVLATEPIRSKALAASH